MQSSSQLEDDFPTYHKGCLFNQNFPTVFDVSSKDITEMQILIFFQCYFAGATMVGVLAFCKKMNDRW